MQRITLKDNEALAKLSILLELTPQEITEKVLKELESYGLIAGDISDCGKSFLEICKENVKSTVIIGQTVFKKSLKNSMEIIELINDLTIWGYEGDCPDCGCEVIRENDGNGKVIWTNEKCINYDNCGYAYSNEPDHN